MDDLNLLLARAYAHGYTDSLLNNDDSGYWNGVNIHEFFEEKVQEALITGNVDWTVVFSGTQSPNERSDSPGRNHH